MRRCHHGRVPVFTVSPGRIQASLDGIDALADPVAGYRRRRRTGQDREFARRVANALIPLTDGQRDKLLALLLNMDGEHDAAWPAAGPGTRRRPGNHTGPPAESRSPQPPPQGPAAANLSRGADSGGEPR